MIGQPFSWAGDLAQAQRRPGISEGGLRTHESPATLIPRLALPTKQ